MSQMNLELLSKILAMAQSGNNGGAGVATAPQIDASNIGQQAPMPQQQGENQFTAQEFADEFNKVKKNRITKIAKEMPFEQLLRVTNKLNTQGQNGGGIGQPVGMSAQSPLQARAYQPTQTPQVQMQPQARQAVQQTPQSSPQAAPNNAINTSSGQGIRNMGRDVTVSKVPQKQPGIFGDTKKESISNFLQALVTSQTNIPTPGATRLARRNAAYTSQMETAQDLIKEKFKAQTKAETLKSLFKIATGDTSSLNIGSSNTGQSGKSKQMNKSDKLQQISSQDYQPFSQKEMQVLAAKGQLKREYGIEIPETKQERLRRISEEETERVAARLDAIEKERGAQAAKEAEKTERGFMRASGALQTTMDSFIDFAEVQFEKFGTKPGDYLGFIDQLTPTQMNEFKDAFVGSTIEGAAQIGKLAISGARGLNLISVFKKSSPRLGGTMMSNINNAATSMRSNLDRAISDNMLVYSEETGEMVPIRDYLIDEKTGKTLSQLSLNEVVRARNDIAKNFGKEYRDEMLLKVFNRNPNLLSEDALKEAQVLNLSAKSEDLKAINDELAANMAELEKLNRLGV